MKNKGCESHQNRISSLMRKAVFLIMFLCAAVYAKPAYADLTPTPSKIMEMNYPIVGNYLKDSFLRSYSVPSWVASGIQTKWSSNNVQLDSATTVFESGKTYDYQCEFRTSGSTSNYAKPSGTDTGWGINMMEIPGATFGRNIERTYTPDKIDVTTRAESGNTYYFVTLTFHNIRPLGVINEYNELPFKWENHPSGEYKEGDSFEYDIVPSQGYGNQFEVPSGGVKWYSDSFISPLSYTARVTGGQYYNLELAVIIKEPYEIEDWSNPAGVHLDLPGGFTVKNVQAFPDEKKLVYRLSDFKAVRTIDEFSVSGLTAPTAGNKPSTAGITLTTADSNPLNPVTVTASEFTWGGTLDKSGNFMPGQHYTLTMKYDIDYNGDIYEYKGVINNKVSVSAGKVENVTFDGSPFGKLTIGFDTPKENWNVTFDANGGTGTMAGVQVEKGTEYKLPACTFTAPSGKVFDKWDKGPVGSRIKVNADLKLKAMWKDNSVSAPGTTPNKPVSAPGTTTNKSVPAPGTTLNDAAGKASYKVTDSTPAAPAVAYTGTTNKKAAQIRIPDAVTIGGVTYKITSIAPNAFKGNKKIKKVTIGANVVEIGKKAFYGCKKLASVNCKSSVLKKIGVSAFQGDVKLTKITLKTKLLTNKSVGKKAFKGTSGKLTVKVPSRAKKAYRKFFRKKGNKKVKIK